MHKLVQILALILRLTLLPNAIAILENVCLLVTMGNAVAASPCAVPCTISNETSLWTAASTLAPLVLSP